MSLGIENLTNAYIPNYINYQNREIGKSNSSSFVSVLSAEETKNTKELQAEGDLAISKVEKYTRYLNSKYGNVTIQSIGRGQASLNRAGKSMRGNDVIIAPNILEEMANNPEKAAYYEGKIDSFLMIS